MMIVVSMEGTYTGPTSSGQLITPLYATSRKLSGHLPVDYLRDMDIQQALVITIDAKFATPSPDCLAAKLTYVQFSLPDNLLNAFKKKLRNCMLNKGM